MFTGEQSVFPTPSPPSQRVPQPQLNDPCSVSKINGHVRKDGLYNENSHKVNSSTGTFIHDNASFATSSESKNTNANRGFYQRCSDVESSDYYQQHPRSSNPSSVRASAFGNLAHHQQSADSTLGHQLPHSQQRTFSSKFLPFAYYGTASSFENFSAHSTMNLRQDQETPLDYSKSAYSRNSFSGRFAKTGMEMYPTNCFVSPGFAGLAHL